jgi:BirA family biotin operon repressor/biotin-[acetyl-CoA-carboxylase] ligase
VAELQDRLCQIEPGLKLEVVAEIGSTNTALVEQARTDAPGPAVPRLLVAEQQTQGRGRQGRAWQSARGASLTFSLALPLARLNKAWRWRGACGAGPGPSSTPAGLWSWRPCWPR